MQTLDHYILQVDEGAPMWVKNNSATLYEQQEKATYNIRITAVDMCNQKGQELSADIIPDSPPTTGEQDSTTDGAKKGRVTDLVKMFTLLEFY